MRGHAGDLDHGSRTRAATSAGAKWNDAGETVAAWHTATCSSTRSYKIVIGCAQSVFNVLGPGLPESVYVGALELECQRHGLHVAREYSIAVYYDDVIVGSYRADLLIERRLIVECKACPFHESHGKQLITYLRCSDVELGLVISFDPQPHVKRFIMRNAIKRHFQVCSAASAPPVPAPRPTVGRESS